MSKRWKKRGVTDRFNVAFEGIFETIRSERHMKFHCFCTIIILIVALFLELSKFEMIALILSISLVWIAELFNTAIETTIDMFTTSYNRLAKKAKDIASGAVLIASFNAMLVGYIIFEKKVPRSLKVIFSTLKSSYQHTVFTIFSLIFIIVIAIKTLTKKGTPLRGGFPSGHSALATAILTLITSQTDNPKIFFLALILTILVIHSRIEGKIHTFFETIIGAILGWAITYLILLI